MAIQSLDTKIDRLIAEVATRRAALDKSSRSWVTTCAFSFNFTDAGPVVSIQTAPAAQVFEVIRFLELLQLTPKKPSIPDYDNFLPMWKGFAITQWLADCDTRLAKLSYAAEAKKLNEVEQVLATLVSPEQRRLAEVARIEKLLDN